MSRHAYLTNKGQTAALAVGGNAVIDLDNRMQNGYIELTLAGTLNVAGAATTATRNRGLISSAMQFSVLENGSQEWGLPIEGRLASFLSTSLSARTQSVIALAAGSLAVGSYPMRETIRLPFANPLAISPRETNYMERNPNARFQLQAFLKSNAVACLQSVGAATVTLTGVTVTVQQFADPAEPSLPIFKPRYREITQNVVAANPQDVFRIDTPYRLQAMILTQEADVSGGGTVETNDIINGLQLLGDSGKYLIGPNDSSFRSLVERSEQEFGGDVTAGGTFAYLALNFQRSGRLSDVPFPSREYSNFRLQINSQPSVLAGATASRYRLGIIELTRPDPVGGWRTVSEELPEFVKL